MANFTYESPPFDGSGPDDTLTCLSTSDAIRGANLFGTRRASTPLRPPTATGLPKAPFPTAIPLTKAMV
eukprot:CAMPEP_0184747314 /NCGR_PEP_ID=MMETSP0315-20130426/10284_1 /TAXON_ID=101924 /ORGANISM="Rhodosorus marinus, Strain UTEX LB 2760" /LENGTH=68 /DNA_ID=CAMNT_0027220271 /DNA_START=80 /DNA_END=286 /DNA_ORIENTATION=+